MVGSFLWRDALALSSRVVAALLASYTPTATTTTSCFLVVVLGSRRIHQRYTACINSLKTREKGRRRKVETKSRDAPGKGLNKPFTGGREWTNKMNGFLGLLSGAKSACQKLAVRLLKEIKS